MFKVPNEYRVTEGPFASDDSYGCTGVFEIPYLESKGDNKVILLNKKPSKHGSSKEFYSKFFIIADNGLNGHPDHRGWEHVSVHKIFNGKPYIPSWNDMCFIKDMFWGEEDCVVQYHPPKSMYINNAEYVLHLWKPVGFDILRPPKCLVGI